MTDKEQHELIGKVVSEYQERNRELQMLKIKAQQIGENLVEIGIQLKKGPEFLIFSGETVSLRFYNDQQFKKDILVDCNAIADLCNQIRNLMDDLQHLEEQKRGLGI